MMGEAHHRIRRDRSNIIATEIVPTGTTGEATTTVTGRESVRAYGQISLTLMHSRSKDNTLSRARTQVVPVRESIGTDHYGPDVFVCENNTPQDPPNPYKLDREHGQNFSDITQDKVNTASWSILTYGSEDTSKHRQSGYPIPSMFEPKH
jgi:hypothetical protein